VPKLEAFDANPLNMVWVMPAEGAV